MSADSVNKFADIGRLSTGVASSSRIQTVSLVNETPPSPAGSSNVGYSTTEFEEELQELQSFGMRLGTTLEQTAVELRQTGASPTPVLLHDLQQFRQQFHSLQDWLVNQTSLPLNISTAKAARSVVELTRTFEGTVEVRSAEDTLEELSELSHTDGTQHIAIEEVERARQRTLQEIRGGQPDSLAMIRAINSRQHPLCILLRLLTEEETLSDSEWTRMLDQVTTHLGRNVATAVARRKLFLQSPHGADGA